MGSLHLVWASSSNARDTLLPLRLVSRCSLGVWSCLVVLHRPSCAYWHCYKNVDHATFGERRRRLCNWFFAKTYVYKYAWRKKYTCTRFATLIHTYTTHIIYYICTRTHHHTKWRFLCRFSVRACGLCRLLSGCWGILRTLQPHRGYFMVVCDASTCAVVTLSKTRCRLLDSCVVWICIILADTMAWTKYDRAIIFFYS